jgi:uncharacterized OsmC-like protein
MNSIELKTLQAPLKEKYRTEPASAIITLKASGKIGLLACSGDLLLEALVACAGVTLRAVATAIGVEIRNGVVKAEGDLDFRGTLGLSKDIPVGFKSIRLEFNLDSNATAEQIESISKLTERYCVVYQTLTKAVSIETQYHLTQ